MTMFCALHVAQFAQPCARMRRDGRGQRAIRRQEADPVDLPRLLRLGGERRGEEHRTRASEERAAVYHWVRPLTGAARPGRGWIDTA